MNEASYIMYYLVFVVGVFTAFISAIQLLNCERKVNIVECK